ncbi:MAG: type III-B CRISPR module RAMP protein Cmr1 [Desulfobacterales bacterium]|nr:type III-B CRISPR module RAMP protein Cmr1 [Desulfobacterales bacterium]
MYDATLKVEFVSPCFCGGANQTISEIRVFSIRGQLRWWYRICGATKDDKGSTLEDESRLFGSSDKEYGRSSLVVRVDGIENEKKESRWKNNRLLHKYLWYFLGQQNRKPLPEGTIFNLHLFSKNESDLLKGIATATMWINFGALGSRATRGAGCMKLLEISSESDKQEIRKLAEDITNAGRPEQLWKILCRYLRNGEPPFEMYTPNQYTGKDWLEAAGWLAEKWKHLRTHQPEHNYIANNVGMADLDDLKTLQRENQASDDITVRRVVLGMPYEQKFRNGTVVTWQGAGNTSFPGMDRMTSPIHLRIMEIEKGFYPAVLIFPSRLEHCPDKVTGKSKGTSLGTLEVAEEETISKIRMFCPKKWEFKPCHT